MHLFEEQNINSVRKCLKIKYSLLPILEWILWHCVNLWEEGPVPIQAVTNECWQDYLYLELVHNCKRLFILIGVFKLPDTDWGSKTDLQFKEKTRKIWLKLTRPLFKNSPFTTPNTAKCIIYIYTAVHYSRNINFFQKFIIPRSVGTYELVSYCWDMTHSPR